MLKRVPKMTGVKVAPTAANAFVHNSLGLTVGSS